jgi:acyl transferase domain-containing protein
MTEPVFRAGSLSLAALSPIKRALLAQQIRAEADAVLRADPIAIVGMGCRLPGGVNDAEAFWRLLRDGVDAVREIPADRWNAAASYDPDPSAPGKSVTKSGGFLDAIDGFDADFFGILPREAERMDPQQRVFLEVAIEALDHAGLPREHVAGSRTGVFVASYHNDYASSNTTIPRASMAVR